MTFSERRELVPHLMRSIRIDHYGLKKPWIPYHYRDWGMDFDVQLMDNNVLSFIDYGAKFGL